MNKKVEKISSSNHLNLLKKGGALWNYVRGGPHATLHNGNHTNKYFYPALLDSQPELLQEICKIFIEDLNLKFKTSEKTWIVGLERAGNATAYEIARTLGCRYAFLEKENETSMRTRFPIPSDATIYIADCTFTTGGSIEKAIKALKNLGTIQKDIFIIANRSQSKVLDFDGEHYVIRSFINFGYEEWSPDDCPMCAEGSLALKPKQNWRKFNNK